MCYAILFKFFPCGVWMENVGVRFSVSKQGRGQRKYYGSTPSPTPTKFLGGRQFRGILHVALSALVRQYSEAKPHKKKHRCD